MVLQEVLHYILNWVKTNRARDWSLLSPGLSVGPEQNKVLFCILDNKNHFDIKQTLFEA